MSIKTKAPLTPGKIKGINACADVGVSDSGSATG